MRRHLPIALAALLALIAAVLLAYQWAAQPSVLRVAVGPPAGEDSLLVTAMALSFSRDREEIRLKTVAAAGVRDAAEQINRGKADLAVVRSDVVIPPATQSVAVLHKDAAVLMTTPDTGVTDIASLRGKRVGILRNPNANTRLMQLILSHYDIAADAVGLVPLDAAAEIGPALGEGRIHALFVVAPLTGGNMAEAVNAMTRPDHPPVFIPVGEAQAIAQRVPSTESMEVLKGSFGGSRSRPAESFTTLSVTHRLVAHTGIADGVVSELTRLLFAKRPALVADVPLANRIEAPDTSKSAPLPVHPGAMAYYDGEIETFFERYGDWFYLLVMALSIVGSAAATLVSRAAKRSRARDMELLRKLLAIVRASRDVETEAALDALEHTADEILASALARAGTGDIDNAGVAAFTLGLDQARRAISERRHLILEGYVQPRERESGSGLQPVVEQLSHAAE